jgi:hypothetical protein
MKVGSSCFAYESLFLMLVKKDIKVILKGDLVSWTDRIE